MAREPLAQAAPMVTTVARGTRLGSYEVLGSLAMGGMAELFLARKQGQGGFEKVVALKRILPHLAENADFVQMFLDEARIVAQLDHPNVAQVYDIGEAEGSYFFTMEYVAGQDLRHVMRAARSAGGLPLEQALFVVHEVAAGLHHAHEKLGHDGERLGIVHRDVSPANVLLTYEGAVKIVDFGVAKARTQSRETQAGTLKGKVAYMSPEQCMGEGVDARSDVFALGVVLYELTVGARPYVARTDYELIMQVAAGNLPAPSTRRPGYPAALEAVVMKALARDREARWSSAEELGLAVAEVAEQLGLRLSAVGMRRFMRTLFGDAARGTPAPGTRALAGGTGMVPAATRTSSGVSELRGSGAGSSSGAPVQLAAGSASGPVRRELEAVPSEVALEMSGRSFEVAEPAAQLDGERDSDGELEAELELVRAVDAVVGDGAAASADAADDDALRSLTAGLPGAHGVPPAAAAPSRAIEGEDSGSAQMIETAAPALGLLWEPSGPSALAEQLEPDGDDGVQPVRLQRTGPLRKLARRPLRALLVLGGAALVVTLALLGWRSLSSGRPPGASAATTRAAVEPSADEVASAVAEPALAPVAPELRAEIAVGGAPAPLAAGVAEVVRAAGEAAAAEPQPVLDPAPATASPGASAGGDDPAASAAPAPSPSPSSRPKSRSRRPAASPGWDPDSPLLPR
ncbi:MAG: protein kinase [Deltaproteobacteria bacterium]|nr:protein kinase [Deltaproteobacteria bacterium]